MNNVNIFIWKFCLFADIVQPETNDRCIALTTKLLTNGKRSSVGGIFIGHRL